MAPGVVTHRAVAIGRVCVVALLVAAGCGGAESQATARDGTDPAPASPPSTACPDRPPTVPTPALAVDGRTVPMDLVFVSGPCLDADGAANLGRDPAIVTVGGAVDVRASSAYEVQASLVEDGEADVPVEDTARVVDGHIRIEMDEISCGMLTVDLVGGGMRGRFASLVEATEGSCAIGRGGTTSP